MRNIILMVALAAFLTGCVPAAKKPIAVTSSDAVAAVITREAVVSKVKRKIKKQQTSNIKDIAIALKTGLPVVVEIGADYCPACKKLKPIIEELAKAYDGKIIFLNLDVYKNMEVARIFGVNVIPTIGFFDKKGNPKGRLQGFQEKDVILKVINELELDK